MAANLRHILLSFVLLGVLSDIALGEYVYYPELKGLLEIHSDAARFQDAQSICNQNGATIAAPTNKLLAKTIKDFITANSFTSVYIDARAKYEPDLYLSSQNVSLEDMRIAGMFEQLDPLQGDCIAMSIDSIRVVPCNTALQYLCFKLGSKPKRTGCDTDDADYKLDATTDRCYKMHSEAVSWSEANATCAREGGYLAVLNDEEEARVLHEMGYPGNSQFLAVGLRGKEGYSNKWYSHDGTPVDKLYNSWYVNYKPADPCCKCGYLNNGGKLADWSCDSKYPFVCEK